MPPKKKGKPTLRTAADVTAEKEKLAKLVELPYTASGVLTSLPLARDIKLDSFSVSIGSTCNTTQTHTSSEQTLTLSV